MRTILHVDLDAFYASVEQRDDASLRGKPVVVGGHSRRGVVCAASYEARVFGVKSAMPMVEALRRCPSAVVLPPRMDHYAGVSREFFAVLDRYSPLVEGLSLDEAFLDVSGEERLFGDGRAIAARIKEDVRRELRLVVSAGVAPSKFVAKIASDVGKPDGLLVVPADGVTAFLHPLPIGRLWGVGRVTEESLRAVGLNTIGDVARVGAEVLPGRVGAAQAAHLLALAEGHDERVVDAGRAPITVGHQDTFAHDHFAREPLRQRLLEQLDRVCARLRSGGWLASTVTVRVKYADHRAVTRQAGLAEASDDASRIYPVVVALFDDVPEIERRGVRLTGVSAGGLVERAAARQLDLLARAAPATTRLGPVLDDIAARFGRGAVTRATHLDDDERDNPLRGMGATTQSTRRREPPPAKRPK